MKLWSVAPLNKSEASAMQEAYGLPPVIAMMLQIRHITTKEEIEDFLYNESYIAPPQDIRDMDKAVRRIQQAIDGGELICVYGDYDADGVTSTALLYSYLEAAGARATYYIPSRESEGYGMNTAAVDHLHEKGVNLIVTVDNGIAAREEVAHAASLGIDTVITDHHMPMNELPSACAVVDLHRSDCPSRFKQLSGVGVAFKLIMALEGEYCGTDALLDNYADLLSIGTIGDIVELKSENRVFVKRGLQSMMQTDRPGIEALIRCSGLSEKPITAGNVSFTLVPRINAVGRLGLSGKSVTLLLTEDMDEAHDIALAMTDDNNERRQIENDILADIDRRITENPAMVYDKVIVIDGENWHQGVIGIVASRVKEAYGKPTVIISRDGANAKASGRSVEGFALCDAVAACADLLTHYGGHPMAVGLSLPVENIGSFRKRINEYAAGCERMPYDTLDISCKLNPAVVTVELVSELDALQPYGAGNPKPVFGFYHMTIDNIIPLSNNKHIKLQLSRGNSRLTALRFFTAAEEFPYRRGDTVDIAATLDRNVFNNTVSVSVILKDIKASSDDSEAILTSGRLFEDFMTGALSDPDGCRQLLPSREDFALLYRFLRTEGHYAFPFETLVSRLDGKLSYGKIRVIIQALRELGLIDVSEGMQRRSITVRRANGRVSLTDAPVIRRLQEVF